MSEGEKFYRLAVEAGRIGTWDLDLRTDECLISPKMAQLMDFSVDRTTVPGARWREAIVPEDRGSMASALAASIESDATFDLEFRIALKDGTQRWLYSRGAVSRDASGKALRVYGASIDVTEIKRAEEELRESNERITNTLESITDDFYAVDREWRFTYINTRALANAQRQRSQKLTREELLGRNVWEEFPEIVGTPFYDKYHEAMREQKTVRIEGYSPLRDTWNEVHAYPSEEGLSVYIRDITERKRAQEALVRVREAERNRIARDLHDGPLQDFSYTAAALGIIMLQSEDTELNERLQGAIDAVRHGAQGLREVVNDLRIEEGEDRPFAEVVESVVKRNRILSRDAEVSLEVGEGLRRASLGETGTQVSRVIQEALTNARRHSGAKRISVSVRTEGDDLLAEVTDDGAGFGPDASPGVGFASMRERAALVGGHLEIEGEEGLGTSVRLRVPMLQRTTE